MQLGIGGATLASVWANNLFGKIKLRNQAQQHALND